MTIPNLPISIRWKNVVLYPETSRSYIYPQRFTPYMRDNYSDAAVYRWGVHSPNGKLESVYIGEADQLLVRVQRVLTPAKAAEGGNTNKRLKDIFDRETASGKNVHLAILDFDPFKLEGVDFAPDRLSDQYVRRVLENICLCVAQAQGCELLNRKIEPVEKLLTEFRKLPVRQQKRELRRLLEVHEGDSET